jgi:hypothetical protein
MSNAAEGWGKLSFKIAMIALVLSLAGIGLSLWALTG